MKRHKPHDGAANQLQLPSRLLSWILTFVGPGECSRMQQVCADWLLPTDQERLLWRYFWQRDFAHLSLSVPDEKNIKELYRREFITQSRAVQGKCTTKLMTSESVQSDLVESRATTLCKTPTSDLVIVVHSQGQLTVFDTRLKLSLGFVTGHTPFTGIACTNDVVVTGDMRNFIIVWTLPKLEIKQCFQVSGHDDYSLTDLVTNGKTVLLRMRKLNRRIAGMDMLESYSLDDTGAPKGAPNWSIAADYESPEPTNVDWKRRCFYVLSYVGKGRRIQEHCLETGSHLRTVLDIESLNRHGMTIPFPNLALDTIHNRLFVFQKSVFWHELETIPDDTVWILDLDANGNQPVKLHCRHNPDIGLLIVQGSLLIAYDNHAWTGAWKAIRIPRHMDTKTIQEWLNCPMKNANDLGPLRFSILWAANHSGIYGILHGYPGDQPKVVCCEWSEEAAESMTGKPLPRRSMWDKLRAWCGL